MKRRKKSAKTPKQVAKISISIFSLSNFLINAKTTHLPPLFPATLKKKKIGGKTLNAKSKSGNTGFDDVTRDGGMANGHNVEDQRIDLSTKSIIIATVPHRKYLFWDEILLLIAMSVSRTSSSLPPPQKTSF